MRFPRSVGFTRNFIFAGNIGDDDGEARLIGGGGRAGFDAMQAAPSALLTLAKTIDFRSADPNAVQVFLGSPYPKIRLAAQYALGWIDEAAVADALFNAYPFTWGIEEKAAEAQDLLDRLMIEGLLYDTNDLMGTLPPPGFSGYFSSNPAIAKFLWQIGVSYGLVRDTKAASEAESVYNAWLKRPYKIGLMRQTELNDLAKRSIADKLTFFYILTMSDEQTLSSPDGLMVRRMLGVLKTVKREEIFNIWASAYEMLWAAGYRW